MALVALVVQVALRIAGLLNQRNKMAIHRVEGPDGRIHEIEGPANATGDQIINFLRGQLEDQRIQGMRAETERLRALEQQVPAPAPETSLFGYAKEVPKGLISGTIGLAETAAIGASALAPDEMEPGIRRMIGATGDILKSPFEASPGYEDSFVRKFSEATGSVGPFLALGPFGVPGLVAAGGLGVAAGAGEGAY